uniref:ADP ribosylation factor like GTPase 9 n=1 Tax=Ornithorhynchus anatinus TaxID=9258 RepID=A0A6I8N652_ORNAN
MDGWMNERGRGWGAGWGTGQGTDLEGGDDALKVKGGGAELQELEGRWRERLSSAPSGSGPGPGPCPPRRAMSGLGLRAIGLAGLAAVGGALVYAAWRTYLSTPRPPTRRAPQKEEEERREGAKPAPEPRFQVKTLKKQVLILGLDGAGKTSILHSLATNRVQRCSTPTQGFNAVCINTEGGQLDFLEIGGSEPFRSYWNMYLSSRPGAHLCGGPQPSPSRISCCQEAPPSADSEGCVASSGGIWQTNRIWKVRLSSLIFTMLWNSQPLATRENCS